VRPRSPAQAAYLEMMRQCPLVFGIGPAGTGKTYLAAALPPTCCTKSGSTG
jgi:phosphate starvation-inducible PhoH-like protein